MRSTRSLAKHQQDGLSVDVVALHVPEGFIPEALFIVCRHIPQPDSVDIVLFVDDIAELCTGNYRGRAFEKVPGKTKVKNFVPLRRHASVSIYQLRRVVVYVIPQIYHDRT